MNNTTTSTTPTLMAIDQPGCRINSDTPQTGICFDNALAESTNGAIKVELVNREQFPTREIATRKIANYIELYYNRRRLHSHLGYITPHEYLTQHTQPPTAA